MEVPEGLRFYKKPRHFFMCFVLLQMFLCAPVSSVLDFGYEHLTEAEGTFHFSRTSLNGTYVWNISVASGYSVQMGFESLVLECHSYSYYTSTCYLLRIYDGVEYNSDNLLFSSYWDPWPGLTISFSNNMLIILTGYSSDLHIGNFSGFYASVPAGSVTRNCGSHITGTKGVITSPSFPNSYTDLLVCNWYIHVDPAYRIIVDLLEFDIQISNDCMYDSLQFRDGNNVSSLLHNVVCGFSKGLLNGMYSSSSDVFLRFVSDWKVTGRGFMANWSIGACGGDLFYENGTLQSPNYPGNYYDNVGCRYNFAFHRPGQQLVLEFLAFDLQESHSNGSCIFDYVEIMDYKNWSDTHPTFVRRYCGRTLPAKVTTYFYTSVRFVSDAFNTGSGFQLRYHHLISIDCGSKLITEKEGTVSSPGFPGTFPGNCKCTWTIQVDTNQVIHLAFNFIHMYPSGSAQGESCLTNSQAHLQVLDGISTDNASSIGIYCGTEVPVPIISSGSAITLIFTSWRNYNLFTGFSTTFTAVEKSAVCGKNVTGMQGIITSPQFPNNYSNLMECEWIISVHPFQNIRLDMHQYDIAESEWCQNDALQIRDGNNASSPLYVTYCGTSSSPHNVLISSGSDLFIRFVSNWNVTGRGFMLVWSVEPCDEIYYTCEQCYSAHQKKTVTRNYQYRTSPN